MVGKLISSQGTYVLILELTKRINITRQQLSWDLLTGYYLYFGSAKGTTSTSLGNRLARHFNNIKNNFWHIDFLTSNIDVILHHVYYKVGTKDTECQNLANFTEKHSVQIVNKFGNSDCRNKCGGHLLYLGSSSEHLDIALNSFEHNKWLKYQEPALGTKIS
jgi:Uri superfamily endonuclease